MSMGNILQDLDKKLKAEAKLKALKEKVRRMKREMNEESEKEKTLREDINHGNVRDLSSAGHQVEPRPMDRARNQRDGEQGNNPGAVGEWQNILNNSHLKQKLFCQSVSHGITAWRQPDDEIHFHFDPYIRGTPYGPYVIRLKPVQGRMVLKGHTLPHAVPVRHLYMDFVRKGRQNQSENLPALLENIFRYIRAFLSRQDQVAELREDFAEDITEFHAMNHLTAIKMVLTLREAASGVGEEDKQLKAEISLNYDKVGERPRPGSLKVFIESFDYTDEDRQALTRQCVVFYTSRLRDAVIEAF